MLHKSSSFVAGAGFAALLLVCAPALAQDVGAAQSFAILGGSAVNANGTGSLINGDVGVSPGTSITGFPANANVVLPFSIHNNDGPAIAARAATLSLFNSSALAPAGGVAITANLSIGGPTSNGHYTPGHYTLASGTAIVPSTITLDGAGIYIFSLASDITTAVGPAGTVILNGADPCMVFWRVPTLATLNGTNFPGTVVAGTGIHLGTGASLTGRALAAAAGDVTLAGGNAVGGCSAAGPGLAATTGITQVASASVALGAALTDTLTLSGGIGSAAPTGTITFRLFGPNDAACAAAPIFTSPPVTVNGNGSYVSPSFTPLVIGTYRWIANYSGDLNNAPTANACNGANENVVVAAGVIPGGGSAPVPTLSEWAMIMLAALLAIAGFAAMRRRNT